MIDLAEVGAFVSSDTPGSFRLRFGLYLPGIRSQDGFEVVVRVIHGDDRFVPGILPCDFPLNFAADHPLGLWTAEVPISPVANTNFGQPGIYLYRYQLWWTSPSSGRQLVTLWFTDPFARRTDIGLLSAIAIPVSRDEFQWTDASYKTPELDDLVVYELQVEEFADSFDGVIRQLPYLESLGVNCLELMPVTSVKLDFDWGYGPLHYFAPNERFGGPAGLKRLVDTCHASGIAVILDVVYQHVDPFFAYKSVYDDVNATPGAPRVASPMIGQNGPFGPQADFSLAFTQNYFMAANRNWLDEYHVDGFRYDEVTDLYQSPTDTAYAKLAYDTYLYSLDLGRFQKDPASYSRIIQCAEALGIARTVLASTYTNCAWQDELLEKARSIVGGNPVDAAFAHVLDPYFNGYPPQKTVVNASGDPVAMPVAPFQYLETHDHSQLIVCAGTVEDGFFPPGDRNRFYKLQPLVIALYTAQGIPMLWQGQEFADNYNLPDRGNARVGLRRDTHWEFFYDQCGSPLIRLYRILGNLRRTHRVLRSRESYYYYLQSLQQGSQTLAYHRHAPATAVLAEEYAMVILNFSDGAAKISLPFPKAGPWREVLDGQMELQIPFDNATQLVTVPSNYGLVFIL